MLSYLTTHRILHHTNEGITVCTVPDKTAGIALGKALLYEIVDKRTMLYLSGGSIQSLYEELAKEEQIEPGAVGLIDERYGPPMWKDSNELMIRNTGFLRYLEIKDIPFYSVLREGKEREAASQAYDEKMRELLSIYQQQIGLIGIGPDGHISSVIPNRSDFHNPWFDQDQADRYVSDFNDSKSHYKERIGMTFLGLSMLDVYIILAFGENKKMMFEKMFASGAEEEIPARFFKRAEIAAKTLLITDQNV